MKYIIFSVKDELTGEFGNPHIRDERVEAREFNYAMTQDPFSQDKTLYRLGIYDTETGEITPKLEKYLEGKPHGKN